MIDYRLLTGSDATRFTSQKYIINHIILNDTLPFPAESAPVASSAQVTTAGAGLPPRAAGAFGVAGFGGGSLGVGGGGGRSTTPMQTSSTPVTRPSSTTPTPWHNDWVVDLSATATYKDWYWSMTNQSINPSVSHLKIHFLHLHQVSIYQVLAIHKMLSILFFTGCQVSLPVWCYLSFSLTLLRLSLFFVSSFSTRVMHVIWIIMGDEKAVSLHCFQLCTVNYFTLYSKLYHPHVTHTCNTHIMMMIMMMHCVDLIKSCYAWRWRKKYIINNVKPEK